MIAETAETDTIAEIDLMTETDALSQDTVGEETTTGQAAEIKIDQPTDMITETDTVVLEMIEIPEIAILTEEAILIEDLLEVGQSKKITEINLQPLSNKLLNLPLMTRKTEKAETQEIAQILETAEKEVIDMKAEIPETDMIAGILEIAETGEIHVQAETLLSAQEIQEILVVKEDLEALLTETEVDMTLEEGMTDMVALMTETEADMSQEEGTRGQKRKALQQGNAHLKDKTELFLCNTK